MKKASEHVGDPAKGPNEVIQISFFQDRTNIKLRATYVRLPPEDPRYQQIFRDEYFGIRQKDNRRVGQPRLRWTRLTFQDLWRQKL
eukprot:4272896-Prorocentrum_lima.AAC.1